MGLKPGAVLCVRPSDVLFSQASISSRFADGRDFAHTFEQLKSGRLQVDCIPTIEVVYGNDELLYSLNNRRLALFQKLEKAGRCTAISVRLVSKPPGWRAKYTTGCGGRYVVMRQTGEIIGGTKASGAYNVSDSSRPAVVSRRHPLAAKTPCKHWPSGTCTRGRSCRFLHEGPTCERNSDARRRQNKPSIEYLQALVGDAIWDDVKVAFAAWWFYGVRAASCLDVILDPVSGAYFVRFFIDAAVLLCPSGDGSLAKEVVLAILKKLFRFYGREDDLKRASALHSLAPSDLSGYPGGPDTAAESGQTRWQRALKTVQDKFFFKATGNQRDSDMCNMLSGDDPAPWTWWAKSQFYGHRALQFYGRRVELNQVPWEGVFDRWLWAIAFAQLRNETFGCADWVLQDRLRMWERYDKLVAMVSHVEIGTLTVE